MAAESSTTSDLVSLKISGEEFAYWTEIEIHLGLDSHASVGFDAPFEPSNAAFRETFRPFSFKPMELSVGGELLFTGTMVDVKPRFDAGQRVVNVSGYSKPAVLDEVDIPADHLPVEANGLSLRQIAERVSSPFGISVVVDADQGGTFKRVKTRQRTVNTKAEADEKLGQFLIELAKQRGLIRTSTPSGELLFTKSVAPGNPVAHFEEGMQPVVEVVPTFDPQSYYSEITGFTTAKRGNVASKWTERNQRISGGVLRSMSFKLDDVEKADAPAAVKAKMGRMFANMVTYVVNVPTWRDPGGKLWKPNTTVTLKAPSAMVYAETELLVRDVYLRGKASERTASLGLVLPGAFSGEQPARMPWEDP